METPKEQQLEEENELLRQQVEALAGSDAELGVLMSLRYGMTQTMAQMLSILAKRAPAAVTRQTFHTLIYGDRSDGGPEPKIFDVRISRLRSILKELGCKGKIDTVVCVGYRANPDLVKWVRDLYDQHMVKE